MRRTIWVLAVAISLAWQTNSGAADDAVLKRILDAHETTNDEFGDLQVRWTVTTTKDAEQNKYRLDFWSKESRFFRLDTTELDSAGNPKPEVSKIIIRPEGYATIESKNADDVGAVVGFGSAAEGFDRLAGNYFFDAATRQGGIFPISDPINAYLSGDNQWSVKGPIKNGSNVVLELVWSDGKNRTESEVRLTQEDYSCENSVMQNFTEGKAVLRIETQKKYDSIRVVPKTHREVWTTSDGATEEWIYSREFCKLESPSMDIFSMPMKGDVVTASYVESWGRRIAVLTIGSILVGSYLWFRRKRRK